MKKLRGKQKSDGVNFGKNQLFGYFHNLLSDNHSVASSPPYDSLIANPTPSASVDDQTRNLIDNLLNTNITLTEVKQMTKKLKTGKATGLDMINAELLKNVNYNFLQLFTLLFNKLLENGHFP